MEFWLDVAESGGLKRRELSVVVSIPDWLKGGSHTRFV
jgi:hypothetical protein